MAGFPLAASLSPRSLFPSPSRMKRLLVAACALVVAAAVRGQTATAAAAASVPENLGLGLRELAVLAQQDGAAARQQISADASVTADVNGRVLVNIYLNGKQAADAVAAAAAALGVDVALVDPSWRSGVISAWLPVSIAAEVAELPGVQSITLALRPSRRVGAVTAQSSVVEHALEVNTAGVVTPQGVLGRGISVGIVSDSYDKAAGVPRASAGVASGDLPGIGNPDGYTEPVVVLADDSNSSVADEGRAMAEVVHDIAPAARICFSAAGGTQSMMAASIRNLRTNAQTRCDIITDDIGFPDEPFFSDGVIAQAVQDVVNSTALAGKQVSFFSASGNNPGAYAADANILSPAVAQAYRGNINLSQVPAQLYAGGFQNVGSPGAPAIAISVTTGTDATHEFSFQWDDPFNRGAVTTDYNLLVFSAAGQYMGSISGTDNNVSTDQPVEVIHLAASKTYQLVISLRTTSAPVARHLRIVSSDGNDFTSDAFPKEAITIYGHAAAAEANCVAAYAYSNTPDTIADY
ncbi:MAG: hypothetical protein M3176_20205, partial [Chloroflexota bacterium]|nr:hypothetical protein [Chloroflexota bacterium]